MSKGSRAIQLATKLHPGQTRSYDMILAQQSRCYATNNTTGRPTRRAITVTSDDGRYHWSELSTGEKAARSTQQSFNFLFVSAGAVGTVRSNIHWRKHLLRISDLHCLPPLPRTLRRRLQNSPIQPRCRTCQRRPKMSRNPGAREPNQSIR